MLIKASYFKRISTVVVLALLFLSIGGRVQGSSSDDNCEDGGEGSDSLDEGECVHVNSPSSGVATSETTTVAEIFCGILKGTTAGSFEFTRVVDNIVTFIGSLVVTTDSGWVAFDIEATTEVVENTSTYESTGTVAEGTGIYAGATGVVRIDGVQDLTTGEFTQTVVGEICGAGEDSSSSDGGSRRLGA